MCFASFLRFQKCDAFYPEGITFNSPGSSEAPPWVSDGYSPYPEGVTQKQDLFGQFHSCVTPSGYGRISVNTQGGASLDPGLLNLTPSG